LLQALRHFVRPWILTVAVVEPFVASRAQRDQIRILVRALLTAQLFVVDLQILSRAADLACPVVPLHHPLTKLLVRVGIQPQAWALRKHSDHEGFWTKWDRNCCRCSPGRNLKNRVIELSKISGLPLSRFAPARKSAQIISRQ
jgi:hypothetical protein